MAVEARLLGVALAAMLLSSSPASFAEPASNAELGRVIDPIWDVLPPEGTPADQIPDEDYRAYVPLMCRVQGGTLEQCQSLQNDTPAAMLTLALGAASAARVRDYDGSGRPTNLRDIFLVIAFPARPLPGPTAGILWDRRNQQMLPLLQRYYPPGAAASRVAGHASIDCFVAPDHHLTCTGMQEDPPGLGFADAAVRMVEENLHATPQTADGTLTSGGRVHINLTFNAP